MSLWFGIPYSPVLVLVSVLIATFGGYVGLGLAAQASDAFGLRRRGLLAGAAWSLGLGIWTMHFVGMLAAQLPEGALYSVPLTLLSFLLCALVVGVAAFIVSNFRSKRNAVPLASAIMGAGIVIMHYLGMHALAGSYMLHHDFRFSMLAVLIAVTSSYGALRLFEREISGRALAFSAVIFGVAVSGMHYTAMAGTEMMQLAEQVKVLGPVVSSEALMLVVAVLAFVVSAVFLLYLVPEKMPTEDVHPISPLLPEVIDKQQPHWVSQVPVESDGTARMFQVEDIHGVQATMHYSLIYDGVREHFSPWSISEMEHKLDPEKFIRIHRSHLVALGKIKKLRKAGDSAVVEIGDGPPRKVPVSRNQYAEEKLKLGFQTRLRGQK